MSEIQKTLNEHVLWLNDATKGASANLSGADLRGANLRGANLRGANLRGADLSGANLRGADLRDAYLSGADLSDANLSGADLRDAYLSGADLRDADLSGADLRRADLRGANLRGTIFDFVNKNLLAEISKIVLADGGQLNMECWHTCDTVHCLAGWAVYLSPNGKALESLFGSQVAGLMLLGAEANSHFFEPDGEVTGWLANLDGMYDE